MSELEKDDPSEPSGGTARAESNHSPHDPRCSSLAVPPADCEADGAEGAAAKDAPPFVAEQFRWRWVVLGFFVITVVHGLILFVLLPALAPLQSVAAIAIGVMPYIVGGGLLGYLSDDETLLEPFYAALVPAFVFPFIVELQRALATNPNDIAQTMARMQWVSVFAPVLVYVMVALLACWVAEKIPSNRRRRQ